MVSLCISRFQAANPSFGPSTFSRSNPIVGSGGGANRPRAVAQEGELPCTTSLVRAAIERFLAY
jgi:hypothetical protein